METIVDKDNYKNEIFFNKDKKIKMGNSHKYKELLVDFGDICSKIELNFKDNYEYSKKLIQSMVREVFKIRSFPTGHVNKTINEEWERYDR